MPAIRFATYQHPPTAVATPVPYPAHRTIWLSVGDRALMRGCPAPKTETGSATGMAARHPAPRRTALREFAVWCVGTTAEGRRCHHHADLQLADLPDWDWYFIQALEFG